MFQFFVISLFAVSVFFFCIAYYVATSISIIFKRVLLLVIIFAYSTAIFCLKIYVCLKEDLNKQEGEQCVIKLRIGLGEVIVITIGVFTIATIQSCRKFRNTGSQTNRSIEGGNIMVGNTSERIIPTISHVISRNQNSPIQNSQANCYRRQNSADSPPSYWSVVNEDEITYCPETLARNSSR